MIEKLPISINVNPELIQQFRQIKAVSNKLEAQFNFQTMTANWYGDEVNITFIQLCVETPEGFVQAQHSQQAKITLFSDDVFYVECSEQALVFCYVALTVTELKLLTEKNKVLSALLEKKLHKVINLIAKKRNLTLI